MAYTPPKIEDMGLQNYLNSTRNVHQGQGYDDFKKLIEGKVSDPGIARVMGVKSRLTIRKWRRIHEKESQE